MGTQKIDIKPAIKPDWKKHPKSWGHPFHPMCSYMAMFPPRIPHYFIARFSNPGDVVLDPFSGRCTTPMQACVEGRIGIASDLNPLAFALAQATLDPPPLEDVLIQLAVMERAYPAFQDQVSLPVGDIRSVFHSVTLRQLAYLKMMLGNSREDRFIRATILGIMHGKYRKNKTDSMYLSIDMPNTFSMSVRYIERFLEANGIKSLPIDVFEKTRSRIMHLYREGIPEQRGFAYSSDVRELHKVLKPDSVQLVVSSPPYLKVVKYGLYNWIRLWFLDVTSKEIDKILDDGHKLPAYLQFMKETIAQMEYLMKPGGIMALVIGDVAEPGGKPLNLAGEVWDAVSESTSFRLVDMVEDEINDNVKVTKIWNKRRGNATKIDRVMVLCRGDAPSVNHPKVSWK